MQKYSIILPVRNGGAFVKECIHHILLQTLNNFNLIVLDNFSSDGTPEWIESLKDSRIVVFRSTESLTIEQNWSRIKEVQKNEFMTMIGHDDLLHADYLQEMDRLIHAHPAASLYQTHFRFIDEHGAFLRNCLPMVEKQEAHEFLESQMTQAIDSTGTGYMMRSADFDDLGGMPAAYPNLIFADYQLWISLMLRGYKATSAKQCFSYRIHQSVSRMTNGMAYQRAFNLYIEYLIKLGSANDKIRQVIDLHGKSFLLYYCQALSHRLLKTPVKLRSISVSDFINQCKQLAIRFIPGQAFQPQKELPIRIAELLDKNSLARTLFQLFKKIK